MFYVHWSDDDDSDVYGPFVSRDEAWHWAISALQDHFTVEESED